MVRSRPTSTQPHRRRPRHEDCSSPRRPTVTATLLFTYLERDRIVCLRADLVLVCVKVNDESVGADD